MASNDSPPKSQAEIQATDGSTEGPTEGATDRATHLPSEQLSDRHLYRHLESSPLALIEWDKEFKVARWSKRAEQIFGWSAAEVLGRRPSDWKFVHEADGERIESTIASFIAGQFESQTEHNRNYTKNGTILDCVWYNSVEVDASGRMQSVVSLVLDETEPRFIERQLVRQTSRLESALEASRMGCWEWDLKTSEVCWVGQMEEIYGYAPGSFRGTIETLAERIHPLDRASASQKVHAALDDHSAYEDEYRILLPDGEVRWIHSRGQIVFDENGRPRCLSGTAVDVTARKSDESLMLEARDLAETSNALKSAFLANMSHEIRTPLGVILGFSELLSDPSLELDERSEYMGVIARNGQHLSRLIDDILDLSKVEANKLEIHPVLCGLRETFNDVVSSVASKFEMKNVKFQLLESGALPEQIWTDVIRFKQILLNLLGNAVKFTDSGEVRMRVSYEAGRDSRLRIRIEDTGVGISKEGRKNLFEPFVQADHSLNRRFGGTGLGLALSRNIARSMGGDISLLRSEVGKGSVFELTLPITTLTPPPGVTEAPSKLADGLKPELLTEMQCARSNLKLEGVRILLAEDAVDNQVLIERLLSKRGVKLTVVGDGLAAVRAAKENDFDLILMDIQMPRLDGYQATRELREAGCELPIVALTAHAMKSEREKSLAAGCSDHLSKPVNPDDLIETILRFAAHRVGAGERRSRVLSDIDSSTESAAESDAKAAGQASSSAAHAPL